MIPHDVENVNKETELIKKQNNKKTQIEIMYLKSVLTEKKFMRGATKADFFFPGKTQRIEVSSLQNFPVVT